MARSPGRLLTLALGLWSGALAQGLAEPAPLAELLAGPGWLRQHLGEPDLLVLHVGPQQQDFERAHIPGSRFLPLEAVARERHGIPNELPPVKDMMWALAPLGLQPGAQVVVYDSGSGMLAARAFMALDYLGVVDRVALLDGQLTGWREAGYPLSTGAPPPPVPSRVQPRLRPEVLVSRLQVADLAWLASRRAGTDLKLVDARSSAQYQGTAAGPGGLRGHLPGADSAPWDLALQGPDRPFLRSVEDLRTLFGVKGLGAEVRPVTYCNSGMKASHGYFVLRYLGYRPRLYDGSISEWAESPELPLETSSQ